jgi:hypothetical protein
MLETKIKVDLKNTFLCKSISISLVYGMGSMDCVVVGDNVVQSRLGQRLFLLCSGHGNVERSKSMKDLFLMMVEP